MEINIQTMAQHAKAMVRAEREKNLREKYGNNTIVLFTAGNYYVTYGESAHDLAQNTGIALTNLNNIWTAEFPTRADYVFFPRCIREGFKFRIIED